MMQPGQLLTLRDKRHRCAALLNPLWTHCATLYPNPPPQHPVQSSRHGHMRHLISAWYGTTVCCPCVRLIEVSSAAACRLQRDLEESEARTMQLRHRATEAEALAR